MSFFSVLSLLVAVSNLLLSAPKAALSLSQPKATSQKNSNLLILGLGNVGRAVADSCLTEDALVFDQIYGTVRSKPSSVKRTREGDNNARNNSNGVVKLPFQTEALESILPTCSHVLVTIPPPQPATDEAWEEQLALERVFDQVVELLPVQSWIGIVSTTGVYGHHDGIWVDEDSSLLCLENSTASAFRDFEVQWQSRILDDDNKRTKAHDLFIFRCSGIYGPDRSALHTVFKRGLPPSKSSNREQKTNTGQGITNRIHVSDIATAIRSAMKFKRSPSNYDLECCAQVRIYNLSDDLPESRHVVMRYAATLLESIGVSVPERTPVSGEKATAGIQSPTTKSPSRPTSRSQRRATELKLVKNGRMKEELLPETGLLYPTYKEGLKAILRLPDRPWSAAR